MTMATRPGVSLRAFRSGDYRELVKTAEDQGWDIYRTGSDHVAVVNPATGARVIMTTTGSTASGHALDNTRAALARAGLDLRSKAERRLHKRRQHKEPLMPKGQLLTEEQRNEIATRRANGEQVKDIAAAVGVSEKAVTTHSPAEYRKPSVHIPGRQQVTPETIAKIREMRLAGKTIDEVSEAVGFSSATVSLYQPDELRKASRYKSGPVEVIKPGRPAVIQEEPTDSVTDIVRRTTEEGGQYPVIRAMVVKQRRYAKMLAEAESMGDDDIQLVLLEKTKLTPLEAEAIRLYESMREESLNGNGNGKSNGQH